MWEWIVSVLIKNILNWLAEGLAEMVSAYKNKKEDQRENKEIREGTENATTEKQAQDANNRAAARLGRRP